MRREREESGNLCDPNGHSGLGKKEKLVVVVAAAEIESQREEAPKL